VDLGRLKGGNEMRGVDKVHYEDARDA